MVVGELARQGLSQVPGTDFWLRRQPLFGRLPLISRASLNRAWHIER